MARTAEPSGHARGAACVVRLAVVHASGNEQRALFRRWPAGVSVVAAESDGRRGGMTVSSLLSLSLETHLIGISIARDASLHEVLLASPDWGLSILAGGQEKLAQHFAQSLEPDELWTGIEVRSDDPRLLCGAVGWLVARTIDAVTTGDHTLFVGEVAFCELGAASASLVYVHRGYVVV
jgi:flavin reductase (DIM6/NTAB) family NADH-FMN oxidoreductase RutF